ncbi:MAG TPA: hypothetical protein VGP07_04890 [Polyangia bacterium]
MTAAENGDVKQRLIAIGSRVARAGLVAGATWVAVLAGLSGCSAPGGPGSASNWNWAATDGGATDSVLPATITPLTCAPAHGSEAMPARSSVMSAQVASSTTTVYTENLINLFKANCGGCHVENSLGNFHVTPPTFSQVVDQSVIDRITSDDPAVYMPPAGVPGSGPYSQRAASDPMVVLTNLLTQWLAQGRPDELFTVPSVDSGTSNSYMLSPQVGMSLTNIGDCVPKGTVGTSANTMDQLDAFFASATALPITLGETDLTTLDSQALAEVNVIAYAPQYPLWSDGSGKLRYIRVPRGQSVTFDKDTQTFDIPPNTRFYKTFLKEVIDSDGNDSFRKIETRIIVARPDTVNADGTTRQNALFGSYVWSDDETTATLSQLPLRDGTPFTDSLFEYTLDEPKEQMIRDSMPANLQYELEVNNPGLKRHYAIPGSQRCVQCHMGSPTTDFVLGFIPLQVARRETGTGGAYEVSGPDELTQLQRLIDYGVITGMSSPADVLPLEKSEGTRTARPLANDAELKAQAYLVGNCAHCHNPRGYPSVKNPDLKDALNFLATSTSGIFQFPLDRFSPLRQRGIQQDIPMPYITPSLREYPVDYTVDEDNWWPKSVKTCAQSTTNVTQSFLCKGRTDSKPAHLSAPWRSLLYRNVDTPFMYADDFVVFPHMPMNSAGYDCRAAPIMADWMVSIPAVRKNPEIDEDAVFGTKAYDTNPQPYVEVLPGDPSYAQAMTDAATRLTDYHTSGRYTFCPDTSDIVDPAVVLAGGNEPIVPSSGPIFDPKDPNMLLQPQTGVPDRAHWVVTDLTEPPGDWGPRRPDWNSVILDNRVDMGDLPQDANLQKQELQSRADVLAEIQTVSLGQNATPTQTLRDLILTEVPFGLWQQKAGCDFSASCKVSEVMAGKPGCGTAVPRWLKQANPAPAADAPVYMQAPGAAVFTNICINCHGPQADSHGLLSDAISNMTGGTARVADFRDGLFGVVSAPGSNRARIFGPADTQLGSDGSTTIGAQVAASGLTADDWGARYMAWMALGGTRAKIPDAILNIVGTTRILGAPRAAHSIPAASPNMLKLAQALCAQVIPLIPPGAVKIDGILDTGALNWSDLTALIDVNGDAEMWQHLCSAGNRVMLRVPVPGTSPPSWVDYETSTSAGVGIDPVNSLYWADDPAHPGTIVYPSDAPVLDDGGRLTNGIQPGNVFPMCLQKPSDPAELAAADRYRAHNPVGGSSGPMIPYCPDYLFQDPKYKLASSYDTDLQQQIYTDANRWATRGAVNAGLAVFTYLDQLERGNVQPKPQYNRCELLPKP